jgi:hypothetical protein
LGGGRLGTNDEDDQDDHRNQRRDTQQTHGQERLSSLPVTACRRAG